MSTPDDMMAAARVRIGDWQLEPALDELRRGETAVKIEPRATRLLYCLAERPGEVHSVEMLLERVWPGVIVGQNSVYQTIAQLRRALGDVGSQARYIATVPRRGYRLIAPVAPLETQEPPSPARASTFPLTAIWVIALVILAVGGSWLAWQRKDTSPRTPEPTVVVMPFADHSSDGGLRTFSDGLTTDVMQALARVSGVRVAEQAAGDSSDVTHVLLGSVRPNQGRVRIAARLIRVSDDLQVWANSWDRALTSAVAVQTEISLAVAESLHAPLTGAPEPARGPTVASNMAAYDLYLLGRHQQLQRTPESIERAIHYHQQALAADPRFALAHAGLADALMGRYYYQTGSLAHTVPLVETQIDAALKLDSELAEAYAARALLRIEQSRPEDAIADLQHAIAIDPNVGEFFLRLGAAYESAARPQEALAAYEQGRSLDPLHTQLHVRRCLALQNLGQHLEADRACARGFELQPSIPNALWARALNSLAQGDAHTAARYYEQALERAPHRADIRTELGIVQLDRDRPDLAAFAFETAREDAEQWRASVEVDSLHLYIAVGDDLGLSRELESAPWIEGASAKDLLQAAYLALTAGSETLAEELRERAVTRADFSDADIRPTLYAVRWGRCEECALALLERRRGSLASADRRTESTLRSLARVEEAGHRWSGVHYVRATLLAQQGKDAAALSELERAAALGWRRGWLTARDPAFEGIRKHPAFEKILIRMRAPPAAQDASLNSSQMPTRYSIS